MLKPLTNVNVGHRAGKRVGSKMDPGNRTHLTNNSRMILRRYQDQGTRMESTSSAEQLLEQLEETVFAHRIVILLYGLVMVLLAMGFVLVRILVCYEKRKLKRRRQELEHLPTAARVSTQDAAERGQAGSPDIYKYSAGADTSEAEPLVIVQLSTCGAKADLEREPESKRENVQEESSTSDTRRTAAEGWSSPEVQARSSGESTGRGGGRTRQTAETVDSAASAEETSTGGQKPDESSWSKELASAQARPDHGETRGTCGVKAAPTPAIDSGFSHPSQPEVSLSVTPVSDGNVAVGDVGV